MSEEWRNRLQRTHKEFVTYDFRECFDAEGGLEQTHSIIKIEGPEGYCDRRIFRSGAYEAGLEECNGD